MEDKNALLNYMRKEINDIERMLKNPKIYYKKNKLIMNLLKTGVAINYLMPFLITGIISFSDFEAKGNIPFAINEVEQNAFVSNYVASNGDEKVSFSFDYENIEDNEFIEYRTGWKENENGFYEQIISSYNTREEIDESEAKEIVMMSKDELDEKLILENVVKIIKSEISVDELNNDDIVAVNLIYEDENNTIMRDETFGENIISTISYLLTMIVWGNLLRVFKKKLTKEKVKKYLDKKYNYYEAKTEMYDRRTLENWKKILELKKANLMLIDESYLDEENKKKLVK